MRRPAAATGVARAAVDDDDDESAEPRLAETDVSCIFGLEVRERIGMRVVGGVVSGLEQREERAATGKGCRELLEQRAESSVAKKQGERKEERRLRRPMNRFRSPRGALHRDQLLTMLGARIVRPHIVRGEEAKCRSGTTPRGGVWCSKKEGVV